MKKLSLILAFCALFFGCNNLTDTVLTSEMNYTSEDSVRSAYPVWSSTAIYNTGDRVSHNNADWEAKWWTTGEEPGTTGEWGVWKSVGGQTQPVLSLSFSADKTSVITGGSVTLTWSASNAATVTASGGWSGSKSLSGSETITALSATTVFTLTAADAAGNKKTSSVTITVSGGSTNYDPDGPYVFYRNGKTIVKTIAPSGPSTTTYATPSQAELKCYLPNRRDFFTVQIRSSLPVEPSVYAEPSKFLAFSDIEGNIDAMVMLLKDAGVMNSNFDWTYGTGHVFIAGDLFDRGSYVTECLWLIYRLETQAAAAGGKIHFVLGNHDIMNMRGDFRYVAQKYRDNAVTLGESLSSFYAKDTELGRWLRTKNIVEKAGKFLIAHGGLSPAVETLNLSFDQMNNYGRHHIDYSCTSSACSVVNGGSSEGIYWYRGMTKKYLYQNEVDSIMRTFGGEHLILGHTVYSTITPLYNYKVLAIDLDHAYNYDRGFMSALVYKNGTLYNFRTDGYNKTHTPL